MSNAASRDAPPGNYVTHHVSRGLVMMQGPSGLTWMFLKLPGHMRSEISQASVSLAARRSGTGVAIDHLGMIACPMSMK